MIEDNLTFVDGIEVRIHRKCVKNLRIRVVAPDGHVEASTPLCMSSGLRVNSSDYRLHRSE